LAPYLHNLLCKGDPLATAFRLLGLPPSVSFIQLRLEGTSHVCLPLCTLGPRSDVVLPCPLVLIKKGNQQSGDLTKQLNYAKGPIA
jgi:hypothetical protein